MGPTEKFHKNKRCTRIGGPQLKIKNQIMAYHWTFGKVLYRTYRKLPPLTENYIMERVSPEIIGLLFEKYLFQYVFKHFLRFYFRYWWN